MDLNLAILAAQQQSRFDTRPSRHRRDGLAGRRTLARLGMRRSGRRQA